jgi:YVTN family beta-propeller protein
VVATIPVGRYPFAPAYDPVNGELYVPNQGSANLTVLNGSTNTIIKTIPVGSDPWTPAYDAQNGALYVPNEGSNNVSVLNGSTDRVVANVPVGLQPYTPVIDTENGEIFVPNSLSSNVSVISGSTNKVIATIKTGSSPYVPSFDGGNGNIYVPNSGSNTVSVINGSTDAVIATIPVGSEPLTPAVDSRSGQVYVANYFSNNVSVINGSTNTVSKTVSVGTYPYGALFVSSTREVYVPNYLSNTVSVIDGARNMVIATIAVGNSPGSLSYDSASGNLFVPDQVSNAVSVISGASNRLIASINVGVSPTASTYDASNGDLYVPNEQSSNVSVIWGGGFYDVNFTESGLPAGTDWSVSLNGGRLSSTTLTIGFNEPNGTYAYIVGAVTGYGASPASGAITVSGGDQNLSILETHLGWISGRVIPTNAAVAVDGSPVLVVAGFFNQSVAAGTHDVHASFPGYTTFDRTAVVSPGVVTTVNVALTDRGWIDGSVVPAAALISINGQPQSVIDGKFNASELGSDPTTQRVGISYNVSAHAIGYVTETQSVVVTPGNVSRVSFTLPEPTAATYDVTFTESGLPPGSGWSVNLSGTLRTTTSSLITFTEPNGTYPFTVRTAVAYFAAPSNGSLIVTGSARDVAVAFLPLLYAVSFVRQGTLTPPDWTVTLLGITNRSNEATIGFQEPNGTNYPFNVSWTATGCVDLRPAGGTLNVSGAPVTESIQVDFSSCTTQIPPPTTTYLGLPSAEGYAVLGGLATAVAAAAAAAFIGGRRGKARSASKGPRPTSDDVEPSRAPIGRESRSGHR